MNTTNSNEIQNIVNKLPTTLFFEQLQDRKQSLKYINWLFTNIPQTKNVDQDKLFREIISKELRIVSMKIVEIEILFMMALKTITLEDFTLDSASLIKKIISENPDKNDLDLMYRILAQIMTKLPLDLRDKVTGKHKLQIFQVISKFINMEPKLLEKFISFNQSLNTPITMDLDAGDYNTLNKKYLDELDKFQKSQPYIDSNSLEYSTIANNMLSTTPTSSKGIKGQYIDTSPDLMTGVSDNKLYYFDSSSGTISEFPMSSQTQVPVSLNDLTNLLSSNKVNKGQIADLIQNLQSPTTTTPTIPITTNPISFLNSIKSKFSFNKSSPSIPSITTYTPSVTVASTVISPIPPQFILSKDDSTQSPYNPVQQPVYNPVQKPTYKPFTQPNSYPTYNPDPCTFPNPPPNCPKNTLSSLPLSINNNLEARYNIRASTYVQSPQSPYITQSRQTTQTTQMTQNPITTQKPSATQQISTFSNMDNYANNEAEFIKKITKKNKDIENVAIAFVTVIILLFLLVIFNSIRNKSGLKIPK